MKTIENRIFDSRGLRSPGRTCSDLAKNSNDLRSVIWEARRHYIRISLLDKDSVDMYGKCLFIQLICANYLLSTARDVEESPI
jgi:hypothetical protein